MWEWAKYFKTVMLQMEPLVVCFYIAEVVPYSIRAVDRLALERKVMLMEIFTWTRYYILCPSESSESSGVSFDSGSLKAPSSSVGWDYDKINITESPSCCCRLFSIQRDWGCLAALHGAALLHSQISVPAELLLLSCLPVLCHFCGRRVSCSPGQLLTGGKNLVIELWNHLQLGREYFQLSQVRLGCVFKCLAFIS